MIMKKAAVKKEGQSEDIVFVPPSGGLGGDVIVPGDKSISHRSVIFGSIAYGVTEVDNFLEGEDNLSTFAAFSAMGVEIERPSPSRLRIKGVGLKGLKEPGDVIDAGNSGTTARLLTGLLSAQPFFTVITGDASLRKRPMKRVIDPLLRMGASICGRQDSTLLPLAITGRRLTGANHSIVIASAQLKSAILLAGLYADGQTSVHEPAASRDHTERMMKLFGAGIKTEDMAVRVKPVKSLTGCSIRVPGDISSAAFLMVGAMITRSSSLLIRDVGVNPTRTGIIKILQKMGARIETINTREISGEPVADIRVKSEHLVGADISGGEMLPAIDEFPIICVAAAFAEGTTTISGAKELRVKESDRIAVMADCMKKLGINVEEKEDGIKIEGRGGGPLQGMRKVKAGVEPTEGVTIESRGDHRIAMSMAVAALNTAKGVTIKGAASVDVSFPGFFSLLSKAGAQ